MIDLAELKRICESVKPGPWNLDEVDGVWDSEWTEVLCGAYDAKTAKFIATARTALPELIAEVERLRSALREIVDQSHHASSVCSKCGQTMYITVGFSETGSAKTDLPVTRRLK